MCLESSLELPKRPNVGINGLPKAVPLNDWLGVTVAEARKQRNDPKGLLDLKPGRPGLDDPAKTPEPCNAPASMLPKTA